MSHTLPIPLPLDLCPHHFTETDHPKVTSHLQTPNSLGICRCVWSFFYFLGHSFLHESLHSWIRNALFEAYTLNPDATLLLWTPLYGLFTGFSFAHLLSKAMEWLLTGLPTSTLDTLIHNFFFFLTDFFFQCGPVLMLLLNLSHYCFCCWCSVFSATRHAGSLAPRPGIEPTPLALESDVPTTGPPGKSPNPFLTLL